MEISSSLAQQVLQTELEKANIQVDYIQLEEKSLAVEIDMFNNNNNSNNNKNTTIDNNTFLRRKDKPIIGKVKIGEYETNIHQPSNPLLVSQTLFYENPRQSAILLDLMIDFELEQHLYSLEIKELEKINLLIVS